MRAIQVHYTGLSGFRILLSLVVAGWLELLVFPESMAAFIPPWSSLVIIFWCAWHPRQLRLGYAWIYGLLLDLLLFTPFGLHALSKALLALLAGHWYERFSTYGLSRQCLTVLMLCLIESLLIFTVYQIAGTQPRIADYWPGAVAAALFWPLCLILLRSRHAENDVV